MQFDSLAFLVFFGLILGLYQLKLSWNRKKDILILASYIFYASWNPWFLPLLVFSSTIDWWASLRMNRSEGRARAAWLGAVLVFNLSILAYFKYALFFTKNVFAMLGMMGLDREVPSYSLILPLGISFYTFHSLSYCIDVYHRRFAPTTNLRDYLLYVAFFPQLVAGPIVRWTQMREQIEIPRKSTWGGIALGVAMMILGLFEKIVLADGIFAPVANSSFAAEQPGNLEVWVGVIAFSGQIFCDFAGYSTCAIGAALALGFKLPYNFKNPYASLGFSDFWQRWHISLSTWLRDYLYIPLGGNRGGDWLTYRNLMITMLVGGLWHGAGWTFIIWGGIHGSYLIIERVLRAHVVLAPFWLVGLRPLIMLLTLVGVMFGWAWFRAADVAQGLHFTKQMLWLGNDGVAQPALTGLQLVSLWAFALLLATHALFRNRSLPEAFNKCPAVVLGLVLGLAVSAILLSPGAGIAFIYFQF